MGQKVSPKGLRIGVNKEWDSVWFRDKENFAKNLKNDNVIRKFIKEKYYSCALSRIQLERTQNKLVVNIFTARPGVLIGVKGAGIEQMKNEIAKVGKLGANDITINIKEIKQPDLDATLVAESIASQLEKRVAVNRALKQAITRVEKTGVQGVKVEISGRLDGHDIAASKHTQVGSLPLQTLRADIDYGTASAHTTYGVVGVKCWIYKGDVIGDNKQTAQGGNN